MTRDHRLLAFAGAKRSAHLTIAYTWPPEGHRLSASPSSSPGSLVVPESNLALALNQATAFVRRARELMKQSDKYWAHADECLRMANNTDNLHRRTILLNMSECWQVLATRALLAEEGGRLDTA